MLTSDLSEALALRRRALALVEQAIAVVEANLPRLERLAVTVAPHQPGLCAMLGDAEARLTRLGAQRERLSAALHLAGRARPVEAPGRD